MQIPPPWRVFIAYEFAHNFDDADFSLIAPVIGFYPPTWFGYSVTSVIEDEPLVLEFNSQSDFELISGEFGCQIT